VSDVKPLFRGVRIGSAFHTIGRVVGQLYDLIDESFARFEEL